MTENRRPIPMSQRLLIGEQEAAQMCSVSRNTFRRWVAQGRITPAKLPDDGRRNLYRREDLERFVRSL